MTSIPTCVATSRSHDTGFMFCSLPQIKKEPIDLNSFTPPLVRRFAWRQLQFMKEGHSREDAFEKAEEYYQEEIRQAKECVWCMVGVM